MTSPNPTWKPGDKVSAPVDDKIEIDPAKIAPREMYKFMIGSIVPRPIAFVSTVNSRGEVNLAPFSFFNGVSSKPPIVMLSFSKKQNGEKKDTLRNIEETKHFVINSANEWLIEPLVYCAAEFPHGVNEMSKVGLTPEPSRLIKPPRVKEAAIQMECELYKIVPIGDEPDPLNIVVFGKIILVHINKNAYQNGKISYSEVNNIGRLGGTSYSKITDIFDIAIPQVT